jgi:hypothetical protein
MTATAKDGNSIDDIAAKIRETAGVTENESERQFRFYIRNAARSCGNCAKCGRELGAAEAIWRQRMAHSRLLDSRACCTPPVYHRKHQRIEDNQTVSRGILLALARWHRGRLPSLG